MMRVLGDEDELLLTADEVLPVVDAPLVYVEELLPEVALLVLPKEDDLPESPAAEAVLLFAELVLYTPELLPERLVARLLTEPK